MKRLGNLALVLSIAAAMANLGCYDWVAIRPTELPRLNGGEVVRTGTISTRDQNGNTTMRPSYGLLSVPMETPDGMLIDVSPDTEVRVRSADGTETVYEQPLLAAVEGESLVIRSASHRAADLALSSIDSVEVQQPNSAKSTALVTLGTIGVLAVIGGAFGIISLATN